jgi:lipid-A-disaccharide synthase
VDEVLIVAGEASADLHGAKVLAALKQSRPDLEVFGVGGDEMRALGLDPIARAEDISVAGLTEVLLSIPRILRIMRALVRAAEQRRPKLAILIDLPDFNLRLAARLKAIGVPVVYYISPQVWAWRQKRVHEIKRIVDRMLVILPFEQSFYEAHGVRAEFVGHPLVEELPARPDRALARQLLGLPANRPIVALLPGSRHKEITRHLPLMLRAFELVRQKMPEAMAVIPVASTIPRPLIEGLVRAAGGAFTIVDGRSTEVLSAADAAVVCSGTATLQTALLARPMVVVYRVSWLTYQIVKRLVKVAHIALVNLIVGRALVKELVQDAFTAENVATELQRLLGDAPARAALEAELSLVRQQLGGVGTAQRVADVALEYVGRAPGRPAEADDAHGG